MVTVAAQPIAGVSAGKESMIETMYPSVASTNLGRTMGRLYNSIPLKINGIWLSHLLFPLPTFIVPLTIYAAQKVFGYRYVLTNQSLAIWKMLGVRLISRVPLTDIADIEIRQQLGQEFYGAADLYVLNAQGQTVLQLDGVRYPKRFRQAILETRNAVLQVQKSLAAIESRHSA